LSPEGLASSVNDGTRQVRIRGIKSPVPLKFDKDGNPARTPQAVILKHLNRDELYFLKLWRDSGWNIAEATAKSGVTPEMAERLVKKLSVFQEEDEKVQALCKIPTPEYVAAKNLEGFYTDSFSDGQRDHLKELAKMTGAYKTVASLSITQNVFNLPKLTPEIEAKFKQLAKEALDTEAA